MNNLGLIILATVLLYSFLFAYGIAKKNISKKRLFYSGTFVWFVITLILAKYYPSGNDVKVNFIPVIKLYQGGDYLINFILTFFLFVPFGFIMTIYGYLHNEKLLLLKIAMFSLIIAMTTEMLQLIPLGNTFSIDHMIANTAGACFGSLLCFMFVRKKV